MERKLIGDWLFEARGGRWAIYHLCTPEAKDYAQGKRRHKKERYLLCRNPECKKRFPYPPRNRRENKKHCEQYMELKTKRVITKDQQALSNTRKVASLDGSPKCRRCGEGAPKGIVMYALLRRVKV